MFFNLSIKKPLILKNRFYKMHVYHALAMSNDLKIIIITSSLIVEKWILFMLTSWNLFLINTTTFVIFAFNWTTKLSVYILIISQAKLIKKFSFFSRIFLIKINIKIINVFEFALTTIQNILKKFFKFDEKIATLKRNSS